MRTSKLNSKKVHVVGAAALAMSLIGAIAAEGQVVINMPPPTKAVAPPAVQIQQPSEGDLALNRYAQARRGPNGTYGLYNYSGYPYYGYNGYYGNSWFGWPFFVTTTNCHRPFKCGPIHCGNGFKAGGFAMKGCVR